MENWWGVIIERWLIAIGGATPPPICYGCI